MQRSAGKHLEGRRVSLFIEGKGVSPYAGPQQPLGFYRTELQDRRCQGVQPLSERVFFFFKQHLKASTPQQLKKSGDAQNRYSLVKGSQQGVFQFLHFVINLFCAD